MRLPCWKIGNQVENHLQRDEDVTDNFCLQRGTFSSRFYTLFADDKEVQEFLNNSVAFKTKIESIQKGEFFQ